MKKKAVGWGLMLFLSLCFIGAQESQEKKINWITEYPEGMKIAGEKKKPVLIFFYAPWSQPSTKMLSAVWEQPHVIAAADKFVCISVNVDTHHYKTGFDVKTYPTLIFSDPEGKEIFRRSGFQNVTENHSGRLPAAIDCRHLF